MPFLYHITKKQYLENIEDIGLVPRARHPSTANSAGATLGTRDAKISELMITSLRSHLMKLLAEGYSVQQILNRRTGTAAFETSRIMATDDTHAPVGGIPTRKGVLLIDEQTGYGFADYRASLGHPAGPPEQRPVKVVVRKGAVPAPLSLSQQVRAAVIGNAGAAQLNFVAIQLDQTHFLVTLARKKATIQQDYEEKTSGSRVHFFEKRDLPAKLASYGRHINNGNYRELAVLQIDADQIPDLRQDPAEHEGRITSIDVAPQHIRVKDDVSVAIVNTPGFFDAGWQTLGEVNAHNYIQHLFPDAVV